MLKKKGIFSKDEDYLIIYLKSQGFTWKKISESFPNKTIKQIRDHYNQHLKSVSIIKEWSEEEDENLIRLVNILGKKWKLISQIIKTKTQEQVKNRYIIIKKMYKFNFKNLLP